jgi:hypothetical protein
MKESLKLASFDAVAACFPSEDTLQLQVRSNIIVYKVAVLWEHAYNLDRACPFD